jgi:hypothetical protein
VQTGTWNVAVKQREEEVRDRTETAKEWKQMFSTLHYEVYSKRERDGERGGGIERERDRIIKERKV